MILIKVTPWAGGSKSLTRGRLSENVKRKWKETKYKQLLEVLFPKIAKKWSYKLYKYGVKRIFI